MAEGKCLCGAVKIIAETVKPGLHVCHCGMCRKWAGGPGMVAECGDAVRFEGEESITNFVSSEWAERGFCKACGTHLYYRLQGGTQYYVPAGIFDTDIEGTLESQIFIDRKPGYYDFANETKTMTEAEVMAAFAES